MAAVMKAQVMAVPRSGCATISRQKIKVGKIAGNMVWRRSVMSADGSPENAP